MGNRKSLGYGLQLETNVVQVILHTRQHYKFQKKKKKFDVNLSPKNYLDKLVDQNDEMLKQVLVNFFIVFTTLFDFVLQMLLLQQHCCNIYVYTIVIDNSIQVFFLLNGTSEAYVKEYNFQAWKNCKERVNDIWQNIQTIFLL